MGLKGTRKVKSEGLTLQPKRQLPVDTEASTVLEALINGRSSFRFYN
ncbi:hypothetical protein ISN45_At02g031290 [Arabidopsis thaliana x Arabidopsis arenosa]|uniref:Uncharacterized protein n=2 Tax=Arabidopsis TaxID=3701 RepID=A0A8T2G3W2_ARASU|nr:hypothetical protein ISN45_At02g031290 [Arabidopsis thaliana x Arabidopsis arenosa]KAG7643335.1 hypothetical protein ISN44_As02g031540 [Arabidopsis suecica]